MSVLHSLLTPLALLSYTYHAHKETIYPNIFHMGANRHCVSDPIILPPEYSGIL